MGCYKPNLHEMLSLNVIDSSVLSICLILCFFAVKNEIQGILEQSTIENQNLSNCETLLLALFIETFLK